MLQKYNEIYDIAWHLHLEISAQNQHKHINVYYIARGTPNKATVLCGKSDL